MQIFRLKYLGNGGSFFYRFFIWPHFLVSYMRKDKSVILLEFNEIVPWLVDRFIDEGHLPNFKRLRDQSKVMVTDAEEEQKHLEPWIQWITVHSGMTYEEHGVFHLADGYKLNNKCLWDLVSDSGGKVWICGSMNVRYDRPLNGLLLPDAWSTGAIPYPDTLMPFCKFVQTYVQEHTNAKVPLSKADYFNFIKYMVLHGLSFDTILQVAKQLVGEKLGSRDGWQRAVLLDKFQWDIFAHHYKKEKPNIATFFSNSTAHYQHKYWRNLEPDAFEMKPTEEEQAKYGNAVLFGYQEMDKTIGKCLSLAGDDATVILSSSLSQQPYTLSEDGDGKGFYRPKKLEDFRKAMGLKNVKSYAPVMSEQFHIHFDSKEDVKAAIERLESVTTNGRKALYVKDDDLSVFCGCTIFDHVEKGSMLEILADDGRQVSFYDVFYKADSKKSGMHHPDGIFWLKDSSIKPEIVKEKVPLKNMAPTIMEILGIERPDYMKGSTVNSPESFAQGSEKHVQNRSA